MNKDEHFDPYAKLKPIHQCAIDLRLSGVSYYKISRSSHVNVKEHTVRSWFSLGGICKEAYEWMKKERAKERHELFTHINERLEDIALEAVEVLRMAVKEKNVTAAIKVLELAGYPQAQVQLSEENEGVKLLRQLIVGDERAIKENRINDKN